MMLGRVEGIAGIRSLFNVTVVVVMVVAVVDVVPDFVVGNGLLFADVGKRRMSYVIRNESGRFGGGVVGSV